ncbi:hypothetical protein CLUG_00258 [Clavispora lusitaniae ATCC 42720]|uniref:Potassium channel domain-containing protein n=1 Tax=Clavispora lusitaniae (strain ATCC 42720) TaxID=306902 RepID=C4XWD5_CLAL4|nr:uncharacterized protein CLUG_00258 [Clavispora lusitaniae ATCC 42720]EEQ36135.1 hypothetical protein CLUG_00258 [Clavispora lusitaniae ATCC 42720]KAF5213326.1 Potassium channel [Clavispora lusitaniae]
MDTNNLRKRLTAAKESLGISKNNTVSGLTSTSLARYQDKLRPLFSDEYYQPLQGINENDTEDVFMPRAAAVLNLVLRAPILTITNLSVQPGERHFVLWLLISSYLPLISACIAPLANLISLVGLVEHWRVNGQTHRSVPDQTPVFALNIFSFVLGIVGNSSLVINFSGKMRYIVTHIVSITCWVCAASVLLAAVLISNREFNEDTFYKRSEGFWLAALTIFMYFCCMMTILINLIGYKLRKYPPTFNLDRKERRLMIFTIAFSVWEGVGTLVMAHLIPGINYGSSLYYCTVSVLTIGLGDIVPRSHGAKVFALIFSFIGLIIMGLIVAMIRQVVSSSAGPSVFWHLVEKRRVLLLKELRERNEPMTREKSFHLMRLLRKRVRIHQLNMSLALSFLTFIAFWLIGAMVFHFTEKWSYFNAVYFCFLCLVTIGYGDYKLETNFGKVFFVAWAITAVPMMTILISNVCDTLFESAGRLHTIKKRIFDPKTYYLLLTPSFYFRKMSRDNLEVELEEEEQREEIEENEIQALVEESSGTAISAAQLSEEEVDPLTPRQTLEHYQKRSEQILKRFSAMREALLDSVNSPDKKYDAREWKELLEVLEPEDGGDVDPYFWLGKDSPLRLPIKEPNFALLKIFFRVESDFKGLLAMQKEELRQLNKKVDS